METSERGPHLAESIGRLAPGVTIEAAREELAAIADDLAEEYAENEGWTAEVVDLKTETVGDVAAAAAVVMMTAVGFILLMACVNVANLLLARAGSREREISVRMALGAGRNRVIRQLLTESILLAALGGVLGFLGGLWGFKAMHAALPPTLPPAFAFDLDLKVLSFTILITVGAALVFGLVPAFRATATHGSVLRDGGRSGQTRSAGRIGGALVVLQTAMAVVLLVSGGLLMKSVSEMQSQDFGFVAENTLVARMWPPAHSYENREAVEAFWEAVQHRVEEIPGVEVSGTSQSHPFMGSNWSETVSVLGDGSDPERRRTARLTMASPGYFEALRFGMARGRTFTSADDYDSERVAIVNEAFVERYLSLGDDPLEKTILVGEELQASIVGVVHDVLERGVGEPPEPSLYLPMGQQTIRVRSLVLRTTGEPTAVVDALQDVVAAIDPGIPVYNVETMTSVVRDRVGGFALIGHVMGVFALLSLLLGAVGIYGVTSYAAGQRTSEMGVRLAMGAQRTDVVGIVVRQGVRRTVLGLVIGLGLALSMGGALSGVLVDVSPRDPVVFVTVCAVLLLVSWLGLYLPARRLSRVDPVQALTGDS